MRRGSVHKADAHHLCTVSPVPGKDGFDNLSDSRAESMPLGAKVVGIGAPVTALLRSKRRHPPRMDLV